MPKALALSLHSLNPTCKKILKFAFTGGLGTITNLTLFIILDTFKLEPHLINVLCFLISCTQNYIINHLWTFRIENKNQALSFYLWFKFLSGSLIGFVVNFLIFSLLLKLSPWIYDIHGYSLSLKVIPQGLGILCGMVFNFLLSNFIIFKGKN